MSMKSLAIIMLLLTFGRGQEFREIFLSSLADTLAIDYTAACLLDEVTVRIVDENEIEESGRYVIRINTHKGKTYSHLVFRESEFVDMEEIEIDVYDYKGEKIRHLEKEDAEKSALSPGYVLYNADRYLSFDIEEARFPWYIDVRYRKEIKSLFFWPDWHPQSRIPVLSSSYTLINKKNISYQTRSVGAIPAADTSGSRKEILKWRMTRIPAADYEDFMAPEDKLQTALLFKPLTFELDDVRGTLDSWDDVAAWYNSLASSQYNLSLKMRRQVRELVRDITDDKKKVHTLYRYLQDNTRYVAIELGIGGWKPYAAREVYENKYGDCKDLSTMMVAMLEAVGIPAYPALILTRDKGQLKPDFPSSQFNHCIAFVPLKGDSLWLECTSDYTRPGHVPHWLQDAYALVVRGDKGELVHIPITPAEKNSIHTLTRASIHSDGNINFQTTISLTGDPRLRVISPLTSYKDQDKIAYLKRLISKTGSLNLKSHSWTDNGDTLTIKLRGKLVRAARKSGRRLFFQPSLFSTLTRDNMPDEEVTDRHYPLFFDYAYIRRDEIEFKLPAGYHLEAGADAMTLEAAFGSYRYDYSVSSRIIRFTREFKRTAARVPLTAYGDYLDFIKKIIQQDKTKFVLKK